MQQVLFHFSNSTGNIKTFNYNKKLPAVKKILRDKFVKKKEHFVKYFVVCNIFRMTMF